MPGLVAWLLAGGLVGYWLYPGSLILPTMSGFALALVAFGWWEDRKLRHDIGMLEAKQRMER